MSTVELRGLTKRYDDVAVVRDLDLVVRDGEFLTLLGPSGCGKTTSLRCVAGLETPSEGRICLGDVVVVDCDRRYSMPSHKRGLGMVFQSYALWPHMSVARNVGYPLRVRGVSRAERATRVAESLDLVGLGEYGSRSASALSGGQQQRVALARALVARPRVLLLDEPLSNLDASLRAQMRHELRRIHREAGTTTIYVTHDQLEAAAMSDRVVVMKDGGAKQVGTPQEIFSRPADSWIAQFVGFENLFPAQVEASEDDGLLARPVGWRTSLHCAPRPGQTVGDEVLLAVRSTSITLAPPTQAGDGVDAVVVDTVYLGDLTECTLDVQGTRLVACTSGPPAAREGHVRVRIDPELIVPIGA